ncbi:MAG TPA: NAD(P)-dependent oxidoreductase [Candidatus Binataceae bacterium]|nr:NAD(P)-dependent oxidoreductase [Candidatus Binataceae bacterium]
MNVAWIGTGIMGAPMALRLIRAGHRVRVYNRSRDKAAALVADGAEVASTANDAVRGKEAVFTMVPDTPDLEAVIAAIEPALEEGQLLIDMSTVAPAAARALSAKLIERHVDFLDAPVSGGDTGAKEGTLTIMVGGSEAAFNRARPMLEALGKRITYMGPSGAGQMTKLVNQVAVAINLEATVEALMLAARGGLDPARVLEAIGAGAASSWQLNNLGPKIIAHDYRPGFFVKLIRKDLRLVAEAARASRTALPGLSLVSALFDSAAALGHDLDGTQALAAVFEAMTGAKQ